MTASVSNIAPQAAIPSVTTAFHYVYILQSLKDPRRFYIGRADELVERLARHNRGAVSHTRDFAPWSIRTAIAFRERALAIQFERYLKSGSGRAFAKKRL
jgi:predicted GIY-YIG superfamily endonuclease